MKNPNLLTTLIILAAALASCEKDTIEAKSLASLKVVNAIVEGQTIKIGSRTTTVDNQNNADFGLVPGTTGLYIFPATDSLKPYYNGSIDAGDQEIYTLFLTGDTNNVESVLVNEDLPLHTENTAGIRFIHLAPNTPNLSIKLIDQVEHEFTDIEYKEKTHFKMYPLSGENPSYTFIIFDNQTQEILSEFYVEPPKFKNITLAITNFASGDPAIGVTQVNHF
jgi:hypothetical protein